MEEMKDNQAPTDGKSTQAFKGYTLSELRYQRALTALKREYAKEKVGKKVNHLRSRSVFGGSSKKNKLASATGMLSKAVSGLNYADYAMLGFSLFSSARKMIGMFKRKK